MDKKFKLGTKVRHVISKKTYVVVKYHPGRWYRKLPYYDVSDGVKEPIDYYPWELELTQKTGDSK